MTFKVIILGILLSITCNTTKVLAASLYSFENEIGTIEPLESFKVLDLNTWMIPFLRKDAKKRSIIIGNFIQNYDIILLQEIFFFKRALKIRASLPKEYVGKYPDSGKLLANAGLYNLFKNMTFLETDFAAFQKCKGGECLAKKGVYFMRVKTPQGNILDVYNTHMEAHDEDHAIRLIQFKQIRNFIDKNSGDGLYPVIFAGDFNITDQIFSQYYDMRTILKDFRDTYLVKRGFDESRYTYDSDINTYAEFREKYDQFRKSRYDYIYVRDGKNQCFAVDQAKVVLNKKEILPNTEKYYFASDHFGVETKLDLYPCPAPRETSSQDTWEERNDDNTSSLIGLINSSKKLKRSSRDLTSNTSARN